MKLLVGILCALSLTISAQTAVKHRIAFNRFRVPVFGLFIADADGKNEKRLVRSEEHTSELQSH